MFILLPLNHSYTVIVELPVLGLGLGVDFTLLWILATITMTSWG